MSLAYVVNPRRKSRGKKSKRAHSHKRRSSVHHMRINPRRRHRRRSTAVTVSRRRHHARRYHRNPRRSRRGGGGGFGVKGFINHTLMPATVGAGGALALNLALGYLPLPAALNNNLVKPIVGLLGAGVIGWAGSKVMGRRAGEQMAAGAAVVVVYGVVKNLLQNVAPALPLSGMGTVGWVNPGLPVGEYVGASIPSMSAGTVQPMQSGVGEYVGVM